MKQVFKQKALKSFQVQRGFTLIELLLYVSIVSSLLLAITGFFTFTLESRIKNQSITEVNQQGALIMDHITQTIRNATAITSPAVGSTGSSLTLTVPTAGLSPTIFDVSGGSTVMGYNADGGSTDSGDSNFINATKFTASASGTISTLYAFVGPTIGASPNNKAQMAIYSGDANGPTTLLTSSSDVTLTASSWNAFPISSVSVTSGTIYWLAYNTNGTTAAQNNLRYRIGAANQTKYTSRTYGTWPAPFTGGTFSNFEDSMYAAISTGGGAGTMQIKEGSGAIAAITNDKVEVTGLTFKNLSRPGTDGIVQVSFTVSRSSNSSKSEYSYQKTFVGSAALR
jgi:prepilin-type N-terminal cleavage/methylation domain-containing protein